MDGPGAARAVRVPLALAIATTLGVVLLSGSDQPVTAHPYPHWQELPAPPLTPRTHALGVYAGHRILVLGGDGPVAPARDGAAYDVRTGFWHHLRTPVAITDRDAAVAAAGVVVVRHLRPGHPASWWRYDVRHDEWGRLRDLPGRVGAPSAFGSELYALSGRRVVVYSVQLGRWTPLPGDPIRPALQPRRVSASRSGTVVTGSVADRPGRWFADRWDGLRWHRSRSPRAPETTAHAGRSTRVRVGDRTFVVRDGHAWVHVSFS